MNIEEIKNNIRSIDIQFRGWDNVNNSFCEMYTNIDCMINLKNKNYTIMQYTGFLDKNKKKAFDGDIILSRTGGGKPIRKGVVFFDSEIGAWYVKFENEGKEFQKDLCSTHLNLEPDGKDYGVFEIIGNIFENPEILEI